MAIVSIGNWYVATFVGVLFVQYSGWVAGWLVGWWLCMRTNNCNQRQSQMRPLHEYKRNREMRWHKNGRKQKHTNWKNLLKDFRNGTLSLFIYFFSLAPSSSPAPIHIKIIITSLYKLMKIANNTLTLCKYSFQRYKVHIIINNSYCEKDGDVSSKYDVASSISTEQEPREPMNPIAGFCIM